MNDDDDLRYKSHLKFHDKMKFPGTCKYCKQELAKRRQGS